MTQTYEGSCHCGAVRFQVEADLSNGAGRCNCSICTRVAQLSVLVKPEAFRLLAGEEALSFYEWGHKVSRRYFCRHCGIHCFGRGSLPELGGAFVSANLNCVEALEPTQLKVIYWDGRHNNWEAGPRDRPWPIHAAAA
ncbi:MAG TPA: GFA family protein [Polyangia bacterium]|nr:GFA family protein [Polyangia bacterium]